MLQITESFANCGNDNDLELENCRICLEQVSVSSPQFCECRGNIRHLHKQCLIEWAKRAQKYSDDQRKIYILCDICKSRIYLNVEMRCSAKTSPECQKTICNNLCQFIVLILMIVFFIGILTISLFYYFKNEGEVLILLVVAIVSAIIACLCILLLIGKNIVVWKFQIIGFYSIEQIKPMNSIANSFSNNLE